MCQASLWVLGMRQMARSPQSGAGRGAVRGRGPGAVDQQTESRIQCGIESQEEQPSPGKAGAAFQKDSARLDARRVCGMIQAEKRRKALGQREPHLPRGGGGAPGVTTDVGRCPWPGGSRLSGGSSPAVPRRTPGLSDSHRVWEGRDEVDRGTSLHCPERCRWTLGTGARFSTYRAEP